ncbi:MAG: mechanosensitive ion channel family protein, partial [Nitrosomonas sp.]|nr:mechanosensitive ion channel family protein [Nitrosomonas sp.]
CLLIVALLLVRIFFVHLIKRNSAILSERQRQWATRVKNLTWSIIFFGLFGIWWSEFSNFAFSIAAVALAVVIATKELILCFSGALLRAGSGTFSINDWIEVGPHRGEVIDYNIFSTTLQELDKKPNNYTFTGKTIVVPNSLFLSEPVKNLNFSKRYVFHSFNIVIEPSVNISKLCHWIAAEIDSFSVEFIEVAKRYNTYIEKHTGVDFPGAEPRIIISTNEYAKHIITVIVFCPTEKATELEQQITFGVLEQAYQKC